MDLVINTNTNMCRFYAYCKKTSGLTPVKELAQQENKLKNQDLVTDRPGRYMNSNTAGSGAFEPHKTPKEVLIESFARDIAKELNNLRLLGTYENLIMIADSHMTGLLLQHLDKQAKEWIRNKVQKELIHLSDHELLDYLKKNVQFADS